MIKLDSVSKVYENNTKAIDNISIDLPESGMIAIVGESGSGKSTLLNLLSSNDSPTNGQIFLNDKDYNNLDNTIFISQFAYIYQDFKLIENMTVYQNIMIGHELACENIDYDKVISIARQLGVGELLDQKIYSLSGGQLQRVAIARALVRNPKVIFADEPTGNLDSYNSENVFNLLKTLSKDILVIIVTHDRTISNWADRTITLSDGLIINDVINEQVEHILLENEKVNKEESDIEEILLSMKTKSKKLNLARNNLFSYKKGRTRYRKDSGISANSSIGLSLALINKDIVKKICLILVIVLFISVLVLSSTMIFATPEKTMVNTMRKNNDFLFGIAPTAKSEDYFVNYEEIKYFNGLLNDEGVKSHELVDTAIVNFNWEFLQPKYDVVGPVAYFGMVSFANIKALHIDEPSSLGINMIMGKTPVNNNEIAISKTYYDYLMFYKNFQLDVNGEIYDYVFNTENLLNNIIAPFNVVISGVFDDKNSLDKELMKVNMEDLTTEKDQKALETRLKQAHSQNILIDMIIKSEKSYEEQSSFSGYNSDFKVSGFGALQVSDDYFNYVPLNSKTIDYFSMENLNGIELNAGEIILDQATLYSLSKYFNQKLEVGSTIKLSIVEMMNTLGNLHPKKVYNSKEFLIKNIVDNTNAGGLIMMNNDDYNAWVVEGKQYNQKVICDSQISSGQLTAINKKFKSHMEKYTNTYNCYIKYSIRECSIESVDDLSFIGISNKYIAIPLFLISAFILIAMIKMFYSDIVKSKARELLVLKSLGAKSKDMTKIYGIFCVGLIFLQSMFGVLFGALLIKLFNIFGSNVSGFADSFNIFYLDWASIITCVFSILVINLVSLIISLLGINNKNLRRAFQKAKE